MNNEYRHDPGVSKCIEGIADSANNVCHLRPSDTSGLQWLRLDFGYLVRVASVVVTTESTGSTAASTALSFNFRSPKHRASSGLTRFSGLLQNINHTLVHSAAATGTGRRARQESPDLGVE